MRFSTFAASAPHALAFVDTDGRTYSRAVLAAAVNRLSHALRRRGLGPGDVLAIAAPNCFEFVVTYLAATQIGLYVVPVNWHLTAAEIRYVLEDCEAVVLMTHQRLRGLMLDVLQGMKSGPKFLIASGEIPGFAPLAAFCADESSEPLEDPVLGRVLSYTSATTGRPKGVLLPLADACRALDAAIERRIALGTQPEAHVFLCASMLYHGAPLETVQVAFHMGHVVVLADAGGAEEILRLIERYRVTLAYVVPTVFTRLLGLSEQVRSRYSLASLQKLMHGGAPCPADIKRRMIEWLGPILWEAYGATEGAGTVVGATDWLRYPGTVGKPIPGTRLKILDDEGTELPPGVPGTVYLTRYAGDRFEYRGDPEKTRACHRGEFFTVGDIGYLNEEGYLFLCDRKVDMIIRSGMKVYSVEVENVLALHPSVADCAVFGVPDEATGEAIMAVIQPVSMPEAGGKLRADILQFLSGRLALAKIPRFITFVEQLGRDPTGKLRKRSLRELYWQPRADREVTASHGGDMAGA